MNLTKIDGVFKATSLKEKFKIIHCKVQIQVVYMIKCIVTL